MKFENKKLRHELKFYIHPFQYYSLRSRLQAAMQRDKNSVNENGYHIRSLYFDDARDNALFEKGDGIFKRKKYRIRIYNKSDAKISLERKSRLNEYISKESASLTREEYEKIMRNDAFFLLERSEEILHQFYYGISMHHLVPKVIVDYVREAYIAETGDVRVTFDKELSTVLDTLDIFDPHGVPMLVFRPSLYVLEVKYNEFLPDYIKQLLDISAHSRHAISKYVICREFMMNHHHYR